MPNEGQSTNPTGRDSKVQSGSPSGSSSSSSSDKPEQTPPQTAPEPEVTQDPAAQPGPGDSRENPLPAPAQAQPTGPDGNPVETASEQINAGTPPMTA